MTRPSTMTRLRFALDLKHLLGELLKKLHDRHDGDSQAARFELLGLLEQLEGPVTAADTEVDA